MGQGSATRSQRVAHLLCATAAKIMAGKNGAHTSQYLPQKMRDCAKSSGGGEEELAGGHVPFFAVRVEQNKEHNDAYRVHLQQEHVAEQRAVYGQQL